MNNTKNHLCRGSSTLRALTLPFGGSGGNPFLGAISWKYNMFKYIKTFFKKRKVIKEAHDRASLVAYNNMMYGPINALCEFVGIPHDIYNLCEKCEHLQGHQITKELFLEMFKLHNICRSSLILKNDQ